MAYLNVKADNFITEYYSDFFEVDRLHSKTGSTIISNVKITWLDIVSRSPISDNVPFFNGQEFVEFGRKYELNHITFSPNYAQSNEKAESVVKIVKRMI